MQTKTCTECEIEKSISKYNKDKKGKYGVSAKCKLCRKKNREKNKEKIKKKNNEDYKKNKERIKVRVKEYQKNNKEKIKEYKKEYYNTENGKKKIKKYQEKNKEKIKKDRKEWIEKNKEQLKKKKKEYDIKNQKKHKIYRYENKEEINKRQRERYKNDLQYRLMSNIRSRLWKYLNYQNIKKKENNTTILSIGCSKEYLTDWIKYNKVVDNLNEYHIDHVRPLASFNCKTIEEVIETKCNHWTNLMPVDPDYNQSKHDKEPTKEELSKQELRIYFFKKSQEIKKELEELNFIKWILKEIKLKKK